MRVIGGNRVLRHGDLNPKGFVSSSSTVGIPFTMTPQAVTTWTAGTYEGEAAYYYDLAHGRGRPVIGLHVYDTHKNEEIPILVKVATDNNTQRIWLTWQPVSGRITLYYY